MAHINNPMLHHKYGTVSKIHPPQTPAKMGGGEKEWGSKRPICHSEFVLTDEAQSTLQT